MTSKHSLWNKWVQQNKRFTWLYVINSILLLFLGPIRLLYNFNDCYSIEFSNMYHTAQHTLGYHTSTSFLFIGIAVLAGSILFSYLHSQKKVDFYHSQPISDENRFFNIYSSGLLCFYIPYIATFPLNLMIAKCYGVLNFDFVQFTLASMLIYMLLYFSAYQIAVLMTVLTGNILYSVCLIGVAFIYEMIFRKIITAFCTQFFHNYFFGSELFNNHAENIQCKWSPVWALLQKAENIDCNNSSLEMWEIAGSTCIQAALLSVIIGLVAYFAYKKRPMEHSGSSLVFNWLKPVTKVLLTVLVTFFTLQVFYQEEEYRNPHAFEDAGVFIMALFYLILCLCICHVVFEIIWELDIRAVKKHFGSTLIAGGCTFCLIGSFYFDWFHYDTYVPDEKNVESVSVSFRTLFNDENDIVYMLYDKKSSCVKEVCEAARELCNNNTNYGQNLTNDKSCFTGYFAFHLKNGSTCYRTYKLIVDEAGKTQAENLINADEFKKVIYPFIYDTSYIEDDTISPTLKFVWCDKTNDKKKLKLEGTSQLQKLQQALKTDFEENPDISPYATIDHHSSIGMLTVQYPISDETAYESYYMIFPEYTRTMECLKEIGVTTDITTGYTLEDISSIQIYDKNNEKHKKTINNPEQIKKLLTYTLNDWQLLGTTDFSNYEIDINFSDKYRKSSCASLNKNLPNWVLALFEK